ncbi:MAG: hypothetical protein DRJ47_09305 [Thermoprotei archaeon]|nr:MAG: hypothetical protein DRJ47_09305 [Thermoprotei archaeon]
MIEKNTVKEILSRVVKPKSHVALFYEMEQDLNQMVVHLIRKSIEREELVVHVIREEKISGVEAVAKREGINLGELAKSRALRLLSPDKVYREIPKNIILRWLDILKEGLRMGFTGMRVISDGSWFLEENETKKLLRYEEALGRRFFVPATGICIFNTNLFLDRRMEDLFIKLLVLHSSSIIVGRKKALYVGEDIY